MVFLYGKGGSEDVEHEYKRKEVTTLTLVNAHGNPLNVTTTRASGV